MLCSKSITECLIFRAAKEGLEKSILERLFLLDDGNFVCHLNVQYRMNKSIMEWSSKKLYNKSLVAHKSAEDRLLSLVYICTCAIYLLINK